MIRIRYPKAHGSGELSISGVGTRSDPGIHGEISVGSGWVCFEDEPGRVDGLGTVGAEREVTAVVEQQVRAAIPALVSCDTTLEMGSNLGGRSVGSPVETHGIPEHGGQAELAGGAEYGGPAGAVRGTKKANGRPEDIFQSGIAAVEFFADTADAMNRKPGMRDGVVANEVSGGLDLSDEIRPQADVAPNEKKCDADIVLSQKFEQAAGPRIVGAVVVGESELSRIAAGYESAAKELRLGSHRRIRAGSGTEASSRTGGGESEEHVGPV